MSPLPHLHLPPVTPPTGNSGDCSSDSESEERPVGLSCLVRIDSWIQFLGDPQAAHLALQLRHKLHALVLRRLRAPNKPLTQVRNYIFNLFVYFFVL